MPAFLPVCHMLYQVGSFLILTNNMANFMAVSPDGVVMCTRNCANCRNPLQTPFRKIPLEIKCPYTPILDKKILPVQYVPPHYYGCQLLSEMVATDSTILIFASCSMESIAISYVDFCADMWRKLWGLAREIYADATISKPTVLHGQSAQLKEDLKQYCEKNSRFVAELPVVTGIDANTENRQTSDNCYKWVEKINTEFLDAEELNEKIVELCKESYKVIMQAYNLQR